MSGPFNLYFEMMPVVFDQRGGRDRERQGTEQALTHPNRRCNNGEPQNPLVFVPSETPLPNLLDGPL